jgi:hypothetical protein
MPLFQKPIWYPPTTEDREAAQVLAIRVRVRTPVGGGARNQFLPGAPLAGVRTKGAAIVGGTISPNGNSKFK